MGLVLHWLTLLKAGHTLVDFRFAIFALSSSLRVTERADRIYIPFTDARVNGQRDGGVYLCHYLLFFGGTACSS